MKTRYCGAPKLTLFVKLDILRPNSPKFLYCGSTVSKYSERNLMANYNGFTDAIIFDSLLSPLSKAL
jgi:hypothetical protein